MTLVDRLGTWKRSGLISTEQYAALSALARKDKLSVWVELNALLYVGVLSLIAGVGWTVQIYFADLGDAAVLGTLTLGLAGSVYYCFTRCGAYSNAAVESPSLAFDYVLYAGCLLLSLELSYIEFRFEFLRDAWDYYLLGSAAVFFLLAYRFDNRFVLSLALSSLGGWFGVKISRFDFISDEPLRISALSYGAIILTAGTFMYRQRIKPHFLETYYHLAANVIFIATISGLAERGNTTVYLPLLAMLVIASIVLGVRYRRFGFVVYGTIFGYIGVSIQILRDVDSFATALVYFVVTGTAVAILIAILARRFGREE
jgi:hypothetical protein